MREVKSILRLILIISLVFTMGGLVACGGTRENDPIEVTQDSLEAALIGITDNQMIPAAESFLAETTELSEQIEELCASPTETQLATVQEQWRASYNAWYRLLPYNFGPLTDDLVFPPYTFIDSFRLRGTEYSDTVRSRITTWVEGEETLDDEHFSNQSFQFVGLLALEVSLFEDIEGNPASVAELKDQPRKCEVLKGLSNELVNRANYVVEGWTENYNDTGESFRSVFLAGDSEEGSEPLTELLTSIQENLDYLANRNVVTLASPVAEQTWGAIASFISEIENLLEGTDENSTGLFDLMEDAGYQDEVDTVRSNIALAKEAITDRDAVTLNSAIALLDGNFKREIPDALEINLGINFSDGD